MNQIKSLNHFEIFDEKRARRHFDLAPRLVAAARSRLLQALPVDEIALVQADAAGRRLSRVLVVFS